MMPEIMPPHEYRRRILLVVIGLTPQIVTETLYKLAIDRKPPFIPTEVHLITTSEGANSAKLALLGVAEGQGWLQQFKSDYNFEDIDFTESNIHVIADTEGQFISDDQSTEHNRIASDFITRKVKEFTMDDNSALHVSLAGGRKTMSFYAGYALSLYGRVQDRLSHVLVSHIFQNNKDFFYPRPEPERIEIDNRYYSTDQAKILLSDIPYVRMQQHIPRALLDGQEGFQETVEKIECFCGPDSVRLLISHKIIELNTIQIKLTGLEFAYYLWLCERKLQDKPPVIFNQQNYMPEFLEIYAKVIGRHSGFFEKAEEQAEKTAKEDRFDIQKDYFGSPGSRLKKKITRKLGEKFSKPFLIHAQEQNGRVGYETTLPASAIEIV